MKVTIAITAEQSGIYVQKFFHLTKLFIRPVLTSIEQFKSIDLTVLTGAFIGLSLSTLAAKTYFTV